MLVSFVSFGALFCTIDGLWTGTDALSCAFWIVGITIGVVSLPLYRAIFPQKLSDKELDELQDYVEQINSMSDMGSQKMGVLIATGQDLNILRFSRSMLDMLNISDSDPTKLPHRVSELLPHSFRGPHAKLLAKAFRNDGLPLNLMHPLKNVDLLFPDGKCRKVNVSLGKLGGRWGGVGLKNAYFSAVVSFAGVASPSRSPSRSPTRSPTRSPARSPRSRDGKKSQNFIQRFSLHMYGRQLSESLTSGTLPPTENHLQAGVMFLKWTCGGTEGGERLTSIHVEIERLLSKYFIRRIQSWGDCYLVVSGTQFVEGDDFSSTVSRLTSFAVEAYRTLRLQGTLLNLTFGIHAGPVSIVFVPSASGAPSMTVFGDTVNTAARMQQSSEDGLLHMTESVGRLLQKQTEAAGAKCEGTITVEVMDIKSKGKMETAWFDCAANSFVSHNPHKVLRRTTTGFSGVRFGGKLTSNLDILVLSSDEDEDPPSPTSPTSPCIALRTAMPCPVPIDGNAVSGADVAYDAASTVAVPVAVTASPSSAGWTDADRSRLTTCQG